MALHLDHGDTFELCKSCIDYGFSSVMIDGSHYPFEKNSDVNISTILFNNEVNQLIINDLFTIGER